MNINQMPQAEILGQLIYHGKLHFPGEVGTVTVNGAEWAWEPGTWVVEWADPSGEIHNFAFPDQLNAAKFATELVINARANAHPEECIISAQAQVAATPFSVPGSSRILHPKSVASVGVA